MPTTQTKEQATINQERQLCQVPVSMHSMYLNTELWVVVLEVALEAAALAAASVAESVAALEEVLEVESAEASEEVTLAPEVLTI